MTDRTKRIARLGILTAVGAVLLFLTGVIPSGRLGLMLIASLPVCAAVMMYGWGWALGVYAVTAALSGLLFPSGAAALYALFFGYYPVAKSLFERLRSVWLCRGLKFVLYAAAFLAAYLLFHQTLTGSAAALPWYALFLIGAAAFAVYDWCCSVVIRFYIEKIGRYFP